MAQHQQTKKQEFESVQLFCINTLISQSLKKKTEAFEIKAYRNTLMLIKKKYKFGISQQISISISASWISGSGGGSNFGLVYKQIHSVLW